MAKQEVVRLSRPKGSGLAVSQPIVGKDGNKYRVVELAPNKYMLAGPSPSASVTVDVPDGTDITELDWGKVITTITTLKDGIQKALGGGKTKGGGSTSGGKGGGKGSNPGGAGGSGGSPGGAGGGNTNVTIVIIV